MPIKKLALYYTWPLLPGSLSTARSTCGKPHCACKANRPKLHGPYYRWTGFLNGKRTTVTLTPEQARQCRQRIVRYRALEKQLQQLLRRAFQQAPWS